MASTLPIVFQGGSRAVASYDYFDYFSGAGYKKFYLGASGISGATVYLITTRAIDSSVNTRSLTSSAYSANQDFDLTFNNPAIVKGDAFFNITTQQAVSQNCWITVTVYKVDLAGSTLQIGIGQHAGVNGTGSQQNIRHCVKATLDNTHFGIGEKLRVNVKFTNDIAAGAVSIFFDPGSRQTLTEAISGATIGTDLTAEIPFKIDL